MPVVINKIGEHKNSDAIDKLIHYLFSSPFRVRCGTHMVFGSNESAVINSFKLVQIHHGNTPEKKQIQHVIIGFANHESISDGMAWNIALGAMEYIGQRFQCCFAVHHGSIEQPDYVHIHIAINIISWLDGNRYYENDQNLYNLSGFLNDFTQGMYKWRVGQEQSEPWMAE